MITEDKSNEVARKTEEVRDIIDRMPRRTPRLVALVVISLAFLLLFFGYLIKYPESVSGNVTIRARQAPVRLTAPSSGRLHILVPDNSLVNEDEIFAYIESGANINDFFFLDSLLDKSPIEISISEVEGKKLMLGELSVAYLKLRNSIESIAQYNTNTPFEPRLEQLRIQKKGIKKQLEFLEKQISTQIAANEIRSVNLKKDSLQFYQLHAVNETRYLESKANYLSSVQNLNTLNRERENAINSMADIDIQMSQLEVEKKENEFTLELNLFSSYNELKNQMRQWEQKYTFVAPFDGQLEMLGFWKENTFLQAGEETFAILTNKNPVMAQVFIPAQGAGKVRPGQEVIIKLDNFPYLEFGSITGTVESVSMLTNESEDLIPQQRINGYQVNVELPEQLTTNYGASLDFRHDIKGIAQILVKKRKLIECLFDNLKYMVNE